MSQALLAKEREYRRLNKELEERTRDLMIEIDSVINSQPKNVTFYGSNNSKSNRSYSAASTKDTNELYSENSMTPKENQTEAKIRRNASLPHVFEPAKSHLSRQNIEIENIGEKKGQNTGDKAIINFLKAKVDMLHKELQTTQLEYKRKADYCDRLQSENKKLDESRIKMQNQIDSLKETIVKLESNNTELQSHKCTLNNEISALKKDIEGFKKEIRSLQQQSSNYELRLNRSLENSEKLRNALKFSQIEEKDLRSQIRKLQEDKIIAVKNMEKQRSELSQAFKKQMLLVDNLKKQNAYLAAFKQVQLTEDEFSKLLEWKPQHL